MSEKINILIICLGNICRSPMAEGALRAQLHASALAGKVNVDSAGTSGWHAGHPPDFRAIACAKHHGVDISDLRSRPLCRADFQKFNYIFCADQDNLKAATAMAPQQHRAQLALWLPWTGLAAPATIPDPYYGGETGFEQVWQLVHTAAQLTVTRLLKAM